MTSRVVVRALVALGIGCAGCSDDAGGDPPLDAAASVDGASADAPAPDAPPADASTLARIEARVEYQGTQQGPLIVAVFASVPPMGPPMAFAQVPSPVFPATVLVESLDPGTVYVLALLDVAPSSPSMPGPEDRTVWSEGLTLSAATTTTVTLTLADPGSR